MGVITYADRVKETSITTGTGVLTLDGAASGGFQTFVAGIGDGGTCYYSIELAVSNEWEMGIGTITDAGSDTFSRDLVLSSSNAGALVSFSAGTKEIFCTQPSQALNVEARNKDLIAAKFQMTVAQSASNDVNTILSFDDADSVLFNVGGIRHDPAGGVPIDQRFFVEDALAGRRVEVKLQVAFGVNATGERRIFLTHFGSDDVSKDFAEWRGAPTPGGVRATVSSCSSIFSVSEGDYFRGLARQASGGPLDVTGKISFAVVGETKIDGGDRLGAKIVLKVTQTGVLTGVGTNVSFDDATAENFNLGGFTHDPAGANPDRLIVTADLAGKIVTIKAGITWSGNATGSRNATIRHFNSADVQIGTVGEARQVNTTAIPVNNLSGDFLVQAGDYFVIDGQQDSGSTLSILTNGDLTFLSGVIAGEGGGAGVGEQFGIRVQRTTDHSAIASGASQTIQFNETATYSKGGFSHDPVGAPDRFTVTSEMDGRLAHIAGNIRYASNSTGGRRAILFHFDSADAEKGRSTAAHGASDINTVCNPSMTVEVATGDYFLLSGRQNSGGALDFAATNSGLWMAAELAGEGGGNPIGKQVGGRWQLTVGQSGVVSGVTTDVVFDDTDAENFNVGGGIAHDPVGGSPERFFVLAALNGKLVDASCGIEHQGNATGVRTTVIAHFNSADVLQRQTLTRYDPASDALATYQQSKLLTRVFTGDYFKVQGVQTSTINRSFNPIQTWFQIAEHGSRGGNGDGSTEWTSFVLPVFGWTSGFTPPDGRWRRVGPDTIEVSYYIAVTGAIVGTDLEIGLPTGFTPNVSKLPGSGSVTQVLPGQVRAFDFGTGPLHGMHTWSAGGAGIFPIAQTAFPGDTSFVPTLPFVWAAGDSVSGTFQIPVNELA